MVYRCLFEQSGTFKNEFKKLGYEAYDYDILNDFDETDYQCDLFNEIEKAYVGGESIFDTFNKDDVCLAFFPCTRFEVQILLWFRGEAMQQKNWSEADKLEYCMKLHDELHRNYMLISKMVIVLQKRGIPVIIENPYSTQHYLTNYWCIKPKVIDKDRHASGDYMKKPTQYWFIGIEPKDNFVMEQVNYKKRLSVSNLFGSKDYVVQRSMISKDYVNRFIREFIIDGEPKPLEKEKTLFDYEVQNGV
jgi:hypothetical protein